MAAQYTHEGNARHCHSQTPNCPAKHYSAPDSPTLAYTLHDGSLILIDLKLIDLKLIDLKHDDLQRMDAEFTLLETGYD